MASDDSQQPNLRPNRYLPLVGLSDEIHSEGKQAKLVRVHADSWVLDRLQGMNPREVGALIADALTTQRRGRFLALRGISEGLSDEAIAELEGKREALGGSCVLGDDPVPWLDREMKLPPESEI